MNTLFKRAVTFTDIHFGLKHNSKEHNQDCLDFIDWLIAQAKEKNAETCIFMGDWNHHRSNINTLTLFYTMQALRKLNNAFEQVFIIVGNHDLFYRENREIHSMIVGSEFSNITLIDELTTLDGVTFIPWLVNDEWKSISGITSKYIFGHLELPGFKMNAQVEMPDHGALNKSHMTGQDYVFSGHFHKRQCKGNVHYIGNPFGHNYSDSWDFERGAMFLEWGSDPEYIDYTNGPRFISINLSALMDNIDFYLKPKTYLQVVLDTELSYEEAVFLRETFLSQYEIREFKLIKNTDDDVDIDYSKDVKFKTIDTIVVEELKGIDSETYDTSALIEIYNRL